MKDDKKTLYGVLFILSLIAICVVLYFWKGRGGTPSWGEHRARLDELDSKMKALLAKLKDSHGEGRCDMSSQCKVVGLGAKTCGGYANFLIYSTRDADEPTLLDLVSQFNGVAEEFNTLSLQAAPCGEQPKQIVCINNDCVPR
jgi:hypothetical protein